MTRVVATASTLAAALLAHPAHAAETPLVLSPASDWQLDYGEERCSLARDFANGEHKIGLRIDSYGARHGHRVLIARDLVQAPTVAPLTQVRVGYSPDLRDRAKFFAATGTVGGRQAVWFRSAFLPHERDIKLAGGIDPYDQFEKNINHITIQFGVRQPLRLVTGSMAAPFAALQKCVDNLIATWGIDPAQHWARTRPVLFGELPEGYKRISPVPKSGHPGYTERRDVAMAQAIRGNGDTYPVRVMVDADGKPTACVVQVTLADTYKKSLCEFLAGPFQPALDAQGNPIKSVYLADAR